MSNATKEEIPLSRATVLGTELAYIQDAISRGKLNGGQHYSKLCEAWMESRYGAAKAFLTPSCTHSLEAAALLCDIQPGDEVVMPSYTFSSTANAFVFRGAQIRFVDIRPDTQNIDENLIEAAITPRTKAIVPVHYAGVSCEMDRIIEIADAYHLYVVEDAAQGVHAAWRGKALGTMGDFGCFSFHATKNYTMGEGGALLLRDSGRALDTAVICEKGTNRTAFLQGAVDQYTWVGKGSSYLASELAAAYLYAQLQDADAINERRLHLWERYYKQLSGLAQRERIELPVVPRYCRHNGHIFYMKLSSFKERKALIEHLKGNGIAAAFHYIPLHTSIQGRVCGSFVGKDRFTTDTSQRLLRLPLYNAMTDAQVDRVCESIFAFFRTTLRKEEAAQGFGA